ncbi:FAD-binding monooxygenase [Roseomonas sp. KE2513]|uniref:FAD-dependent monooxygenase n=1 Tax=Roseomonas sp. KE2513 TaxID=2479202 RepID=UPI0018E063EC|nr:FAD-dependent monooxygenase [Roseomonas sp. KE2513]MBI0539395.1 FAD-binding monooxygenase [Roseomonas sp. KE2513]
MDQEAARREYDPAVNITCIGGGPAGLSFAIAAKRRDPTHRITVLERRPEHTTYGWGIVYWDDLLHTLGRVDPPTARSIRASSVRWAGQRVCVQDHRPVHLGGTGYGMSRRRLIDTLVDRARDLGVDVRFDCRIDTVRVHDGADLLVVAEGAGSRLRRAWGNRFGTVERTNRNKHIWLGSTVPLDDFTFAFERTPEGWIWFHGYRFEQGRSTVIVECAQETWKRLGFALADPQSCLTELERIFARHLAGHHLVSQQNGSAFAAWDSFTTVTNMRWYHDHVVLVGDAAHTTHFSVGSGTRLAVQDAIALGDAIAERRPYELDTALQHYQNCRLASVRALQADAARSADWFSAIDRLTSLAPIDFGYSLRTRRELGGSLDTVDQTSLRYQMHLASQWWLGRAIRRAVSRARTAVSRRIT